MLKNGNLKVCEFGCVMYGSLSSILSMQGRILMQDAAFDECSGSLIGNTIPSIILAADRLIFRRVRRVSLAPKFIA
jgi:hypothetical protein